MSDLSNGMPNMQREARFLRHSTREYRFYMAVIFLLAVPCCTVIWLYSLLRHAELPEHGPIHSALSEARSITPRIFWT